MKFTAQFAAPRIDIAGYRAALDRHMREALTQAVMHWLGHVLDVVPCWSGASRATFQRLASTIEVRVPISPVTNDRISQGFAESEGKLNLDEPPGCYTFTYRTSLPWLVWNEYHNANSEPDATKWPPPAKLLQPGPYEFQAKGYLAFIDFAKSVDLPDVAPFIKANQIKG